MGDLSFLAFSVGVIGNIISVLVFLSPIGTFCRIVKNKSTEEFDSLPYIATLLGSSLWTYYGIIKPGAYLVATVNGFGVIVELIYLILFLIFAPRSMKVRSGVLMGIFNVGFVLTAILVSYYEMRSGLRISVIGFISGGLNIVMYASPLGVMKKVVLSRSVEFMPFFLSFFLFLNGGTWAFYAFLVKDPFLGVPNGTGFVLGTAQLILYAIYRNANSSKTLYTSLLEPHSLPQFGRGPELITSSSSSSGEEAVENQKININSQQLVS